MLFRNASKMHIRCGIGTSKTSPSVVPNVVAYTTMIQDFFKKDHFGKVLRPLNEMVGYGVSPNEFV